MTECQDLGYYKIFVSLDGTEAQSEVLKRAIIVAANNNAELYVGHVIDSTALETAGLYPLDLLGSLEQDFRKSIEDQIEEAKSIDSIKNVEVIVKAGRIRETLKEEMLDVIEPDLIICGARGLSSIKYALLGSISTFLTRNAKCDTLVLK
jgi:nucleotide-binding universal stress UspA family protein